MKHILAILTLTLVGATLYFLSSAFLNRETTDALIDQSKDKITQTIDRAQEAIDSGGKASSAAAHDDESAESDFSSGQAIRSATSVELSRNETAAINLRTVRRIEESQRR